MTTDISKILQEYINKLTFQVKVSSVIDNGDGSYTLNSCDTSYLRECKPITINNTGGPVTYTIESVVQDESFTVIGGDMPDAEVIDLPLPFYFHGYVNNTNEELVKVDDYRDKYPMIYLYEIVEEVYNNSLSNPVAFTTNVRLFFMDTTNAEDYKTEDHYVEVIRPMRALVRGFLNDINTDASEIFQEPEQFRIVPWVNFGRFEQDNGTTKYLFNDHLSGVELRIDLNVRRSYINSLNCNKGC